MTIWKKLGKAISFVPSKLDAKIEAAQSEGREPQGLGFPKEDVTATEEEVNAKP